MALRLSLKYGGGNPRWFDELSRADQIAVLAAETLS
jgi:hypothetical protein